MSAIDSNGRLWGRVNLVDALLIVLAIAAGPFAYGSYALWRDPNPRLLEVLPPTLQSGPGLQVEIRGEHLRPYMRVSFGDHQAPGFLFVSPTVSVVPLPTILPGTYDVVLYDYAREVARLPGAFTLSAPASPPTARIAIRGALTGLTESQVALITPGLSLPTANPILTVVSVGPSGPSMARIRVSDGVTVAAPLDQLKEVPVTAMLACTVQLGADGVFRCAGASVPVAPNANILLLAPWGNVNLWIGEIESGVPAPAAAKP